MSLHPDDKHLIERFVGGAYGFVDGDWNSLMTVVRKCHEKRDSDEDHFHMYSGFILDETPIWASFDAVRDRSIAFIKECEQRKNDINNVQYYLP